MSNVVKFKPKAQTETDKVLFISNYLKSNLVDMANIRAKLLKLQKDINTYKKNQLTLISNGKDKKS